MDRRLPRANRAALALVVGLSVLGGATAVRAEESRVLEPDTYVYEAPDTTSAILRRLFRDEVLIVVERVIPPSGEPWVKVRLGDTETGYVQATRVTNAADTQVVRWEPRRVLRDERPVGVGLRRFGKDITSLFGVTLSVRYQLLTRLGVVVDTGSLVTKTRMRGTVLSTGAYTFLVLWNLSPFAEVGFSRLSYQSGVSKLNLTSFYTSMGIEWMFNSGAFVQFYATYLRSVDIEVSYEYADARQGNLTLGDYGVLDLGDAQSYQAVMTGIGVGYAF